MTDQTKSAPEVTMSSYNSSNIVTLYRLPRKALRYLSAGGVRVSIRKISSLYDVRGIQTNMRISYGFDVPTSSGQSCRFFETFSRVHTFHSGPFVSHFEAVGSE